MKHTITSFELCMKILQNWSIVCSLWRAAGLVNHAVVSVMGMSYPKCFALHMRKYISGVSTNGYFTVTLFWLLLLQFTVRALKWRYNELASVSNHQPHDCFLNRLFTCRSTKTSKLCVTGLCEGNSPVTGEFPAQRASNAENVSIWWRHHGILQKYAQGFLLYFVMIILMFSSQWIHVVHLTIYIHNTLRPSRHFADDIF